MEGAASSTCTTQCSTRRKKSERKRSIFVSSGPRLALLFPCGVERVRGETECAAPNRQRRRGGEGRKEGGKARRKREAALLVCCLLIASVAA